MMMAAIEIPDRKARLTQIKKVLSFLPPSNIKALRMLIYFLKQVTEHKETKMNSKALGVVFGPTLMKQKDTDLQTAIKNSQIKTELIASLIDEYTYFFVSEEVEYSEYEKNLEKSEFIISPRSKHQHKKLDKSVFEEPPKDYPQNLQRRKSSKKISIPKVFLEGQNATNNGQLVGKRVKDSILVKKKRKSIMDKKEDVTKKDYSQLKAIKKKPSYVDVVRSSTRKSTKARKVSIFSSLPDDDDSLKDSPTHNTQVNKILEEYEDSDATSDDDGDNPLEKIPEFDTVAERHVQQVMTSLFPDWDYRKSVKFGTLSTRSKKSSKRVTMKDLTKIFQTGYEQSNNTQTVEDSTIQKPSTPPLRLFQPQMEEENFVSYVIKLTSMPENEVNQFLYYNYFVVEIMGNENERSKNRH